MSVAPEASAQELFNAMNHWATADEMQRSAFREFCKVNVSPEAPITSLLLAWECFFQGWKHGFDSGYTDGLAEPR